MITATNPNPSPVGIVDANRLTVDQAVMPTPNMRDVIYGWFRKISLTIVRKTQADFQTQEVEVPHETQGVVQPFTATRLEQKPEGERAWSWWLIHATTDLVLQTDDVIIYAGMRLRIMQKWPFDAHGYVEYHAILDYAYSPQQT
jgi:hypothetical protein